MRLNRLVNFMNPSALSYLFPTDEEEIVSQNYLVHNLSHSFPVDKEQIFIHKPIPPQLESAPIFAIE